MKEIRTRPVDGGAVRMQDSLMNATITVHDDATPSAHYPADEQERNGAVDMSVTIKIPGITTHYCMKCDGEVDSNGFHVDDPGDHVAHGIRSVVTTQPRTITGSITLYRDDANGGRLGTCGAPLDGWCSEEILAYARTLTDSSRRDLLASLAGGVGTETLDLEAAS